MKTKICIVLTAALLLLASCSSANATAEATEPPIEKPIPTDTSPPPTATTDPYTLVTHTDIPVDPIYWDTQKAFECNTGRATPIDAPAVVGAGCNRWKDNYLEIPSASDGSVYDARFDIIEIQMGQDDMWYYARLTTYATNLEDPVLDGAYGFEFDLDFDYRGDILVLVNDPSGFAVGEWHVVGVTAWADANKDVGGEIPVSAEEGYSGDGYETLIFDQGLGDDSDLVWARLSPKVPGAVEFAIKRSILESDGDEVFIWWAWAYQEPLDPALFDLVDALSEAEVAFLDNSCWWIFGDKPREIPNICPYFKPDEPASGPGGCWVKGDTGQVCMSPCPCPPGLGCGGPCP